MHKNQIPSDMALKIIQAYHSVKRFYTDDPYSDEETDDESCDSYEDSDINEESVSNNEHENQINDESDSQDENETPSQLIENLQPLFY